jgi:phosphohistidine phosphatase
MLLYLMRHGIAALREDPLFTNDHERPLTPDGLRKTRDVARGIRRLDLTFDLVFTSELKRARQTADVICAELRLQPSQLRVSRMLEPGVSPLSFFRELEPLADTPSILVVGHEPNMSEMISVLTTGHANALAVEIKKASLALVEVESFPPNGSAALHFLLQPKHLRAVGGKNKPRRLPPGFI